MSKKHNITKEILEQAAKESFSYRELLLKLEYNPNGGGGYETIKKYIKKFEIDVSHFLGRSTAKGKVRSGVTKYTLNEILIKDSPVTQTVLRRYLLRFKVLDYKCAWCGCDGNWFGKTIALELDHINGDNHDNRLENLRFLCPNCHAATNTYCSKNSKTQAAVVEQADTMVSKTIDE